MSWLHGCGDGSVTQHPPHGNTPLFRNMLTRTWKIWRILQGLKGVEVPDCRCRGGSVQNYCSDRSQELHECLIGICQQLCRRENFILILKPFFTLAHEERYKDEARRKKWSYMYFLINVFPIKREELIIRRHEYWNGSLAMYSRKKTKNPTWYLRSRHSIIAVSYDVRYLPFPPMHTYI